MEQIRCEKTKKKKRNLSTKLHFLQNDENALATFLHSTDDITIFFLKVVIHLWTSTSYIKSNFLTLWTWVSTADDGSNVLWFICSFVCFVFGGLFLRRFFLYAIRKFSYKRLSSDPWHRFMKQDIDEGGVCVCVCWGCSVGCGVGVCVWRLLNSRYNFCHWQYHQ